MLPTLNGRIQTRIAVLAVIGGLVTLAVTPALTAARYQVTFTLLITTIVLGIGWEFAYHLLQQFRWEKDWPTPFGLLTALNEGLLVWFLLSSGRLPIGGPVPVRDFLIAFGSVWLVSWLWVNGPMRAPFIRWRFRGGRLI